jgi:hypothetical protein
MKRLKEIVRTLSPTRGKKIRVRAADLIAERKTNAERAQAEKTGARSRVTYKLADLIEQIKPDHRLTEEDRQWLDAPAVGKERYRILQEFQES